MQDPILQPGLRTSGPMPQVLSPGTDEVCSCGQPWSAAACERVFSQREQRRPVLYGISSCIEVEVQQLRCSCGTIKRYDGASDGILNLNNLDLFSHELLEE